MAENKSSFLLYRDIIHMIKKMPDDKAGLLFKHILSYVNDENPVSEDLVVNIAFAPIEQSLKRDLKKYEKVVVRNRENGKRGGRPPKNPKNPSGLQDNPKNPSGLQDNPKNPDIDIDIDIDIENKLKGEFDQVRVLYGGTKRGLDTEFKNFKKKHKDWKAVLPELLLNLQEQIEVREKSTGFIPQWANFSTWINQRKFEEKLKITTDDKADNKTGNRFDRIASLGNNYGKEAEG